ncbi:beta-ketoacyl-[acyl-carrier-protein] synthase family protein [Pseudoalteromonas ostreae]|uniref:beta-ketoacyl-[acyl-carrier-protein] synthase family protein n=1 Tax=Pseudoalteromonas ostreae TaxID=2774154 RepID=UPI001B363283|nr:beta-ketoacyl-[acyl-carrier-protein] synthase family protein [Pseudoalteromonas ostreae]
MKNKVVITGIGVSTGLGHTVEHCWQELNSGMSAVKIIDRFDTSGMKTNIAAYYRDNAVFGTPRGILEQLLEKVVDEAIAEDDEGFDRCYYSLPNGLYDIEPRFAADNAESKVEDHFSTFFYESNLAARILEKYQIRDYPVLVSTACASSASTLQMAYNAIKSGLANRILVIASDCSVSRETITKFSNLSALSTRNDSPETASRPFSASRDGFVIGEGAGAIVLESEAYAQKHGRKICAELAGCASTTDNYHRTRSNPKGHKILDAMSSAIKAANLELEDITFVNAHGTSTPENDKLESDTLSDLFQGFSIPVTSIKSMTGHCLNASGIVQNVFSVKSIMQDVIPPTINYDGTCEHKNIVVVTPQSVRQRTVNHILSNSFGFGGQNVSLVFSKYMSS